MYSAPSSGGLRFPLILVKPGAGIELNIVIRRCKARGVLDRQNPFAWLVCYQRRRVPIVSRQERMSPIVSILRPHQVQALAYRREKRAIFFEELCQHIKSIDRKVPEAVVILSNQPLFSLHVASVFPLEQKLPATEGFKKCPLVIHRASQALHRLLLRGYYAGQCLACQIADWFCHFR